MQNARDLAHKIILCLYQPLFKTRDLEFIEKSQYSDLVMIGAGFGLRETTL